ncbi:MAG: RING finger protein [Armatimonadota bacterium]
MPDELLEGMLCMCCQQPIESASDGMTCPDCGAPHHQACWGRTGNCCRTSCASHAVHTVDELPPEALPPGFAGSLEQGFTPVELRLGAVLGAGWEACVRNLGTLALAFFVLAVIGVACALFRLPGYALLGLLLPVLLGGMLTLALRALNRRDLQVTDLFAGFQRYFHWLGLAILLAAAAAVCALPVWVVTALNYAGKTMGTVSVQTMVTNLLIGAIVSIVIAIPVFLRLMFSGLLVAEGFRPWEALGESWGMTQGLSWRLFGYVIVLKLLAFAGVIALGIGLFVTIPFVCCAFAALFNAVKTQQVALGDPELEVVELE